MVLTAFVLAELARTDSHRFRVLEPDSDQTKALRAMTRSRDGLVRTRQGLANQLRDQLATVWPGAGKVFSSIDSKIALAFLRRYPIPVDARGLGAQRLAALLKRHGYPGRKPARELLTRLRNGAQGRAGEQEMRARREIVLALVSALEPIVARISELTIEIRRRRADIPLTIHRPRFVAVRRHDGRGDRRLPPALPQLPSVGRRRRPMPSRRRIRQVQARPVQMGVRPPTTQSVLHPRRLKPPLQPMGS
jgi:transposase